MKGDAAAQQQAQKRKQEILEKENIVEMYDASGHPLFLIKNSGLLNDIHNSIEFEVADHKRRKEVIKVRIIKHLHEKMESDFKIYMARSMMQKPQNSEIKEA